MDIKEFALERYYDQYEFDESIAHQLSASDCEALSTRDVLQMVVDENRDKSPTTTIDFIQDELLKLKLGYTLTRGSLKLRERIAAFYDGLSADNVLVCNAPQECIFLLMHAVLKPGDKVIAIEPCYASLKEVAAMRQCEVIPFSLQCKEGFKIDLDALQSLLDNNDDVRLLVTNFPHNPTGLLPTMEEFERIASMVRKRTQMYWFNDEMYHALWTDEKRKIPPAATMCENASTFSRVLNCKEKSSHKKLTTNKIVSLWGLSKSFGLPGLRCGWLCSKSAAVLNEVLKWKDYVSFLVSICSNALMEKVAEFALIDAVRDRILRLHTERIRRNTTLFDDFVKKNNVYLSWQKPMAGSIALVTLNRSKLPNDHLITIRNKGALLICGTFFDIDERYARIGLGRDDFPLALKRWQEALDELS